MHRAWQIVAVLAVLGVWPRAAAAFTSESAATVGCHERITKTAWRATRAAVPETTGDLKPRGDDAALITDVPFKVPSTLQTIGPVTLLLGVRDNDVKQHGPVDLKDLNPAAADPKHQAEHCLRAPEHDEPDGSKAAVEACRGFIRQSLFKALDGLDAEGRPNPRVREELRVSLAIRDEIAVQVPTFFLEAGRGLHALQDSFTHTFRRPDDLGKITVVLNFVEYTEGTLEEAVDGPPHASELDDCEGDALIVERTALATEASGAALLALLDPALDRAAKEAAIEQVLDNYVAFDEQSQCNLENNWCDAPELAYGSPPLGCHVSTPRPGGGLLMYAPLALLGLTFWRRRRLVGALALAACMLPKAALAQEASLESNAEATSTPSTPSKRHAGAWLGRVAVGASYDNAAFSTGAGIRYQVFEKWLIGFDAEWNPYVATNPRKVRAGSGNAYFSLIRRAHLAYEPLAIRTTVSLGASTLLFDLVGADKWSVGPFVGVSFLGLDWRTSRHVTFTIDPTYIALPMPSITGIPFMYAQYRFLLGVEFGG